MAIFNSFFLQYYLLTDTTGQILTVDQQYLHKYGFKNASKAWHNYILAFSQYLLKFMLVKRTTEIIKCFRLFLCGTERNLYAAKSPDLTKRWTARFFCSTSFKSSK